MKKLIKWFKGNELLYFTVFGFIFYYNGFLFEFLSFDFAKSDKESALLKFLYVRNDIFIIQLFFFEFEVFNIYKEQ